MGLDLGDQMNLLGEITIAPALWVGIETAGRLASTDGGIVAVRGEDPPRVGSIGVFNHVKQRVFLGLPIDDPVGIEDLMAAMLGVGLREHHQLHIGRITPKPGEG